MKFFFFLIFVTGCSLLVNPDPSKLSPTIPPLVDATVDTSMPDASIDGGEDAKVDASVCNPSDCDKNDGCTISACDASMTTCVSTPVDADKDGYAIAKVGATMCKDGDDCDDANKAVHPGAKEVCDDIDNDCSGQVDDSCETDVCENPGTLTPSAMANGYLIEAIGSSSGFAHLSDNYRISCNTYGSRKEAVYKFTVPVSNPAQLYSFRVNQDTSGTYDHVAVAITEGDRCSGAQLVACLYRPSNDLVLDTLSSGQTYYLYVEDATSSGNAPNFKVSLRLSEFP